MLDAPPHLDSRIGSTSLYVSELESDDSSEVPVRSLAESILSESARSDVMDELDSVVSTTEVVGALVATSLVTFVDCDGLSDVDVKLSAVLGSGIETIPVSGCDASGSTSTEPST